VSVEAPVVAPGGACRARLDDGRWHFQHGPIDCIVGADGEPDAVARAVDAAWARFPGILEELVAELALLRTDLASPEGAAVAPRGPIARRMVAACRAHAHCGRFITAMAAVAGSVAEELIAAFSAEPGVERAYVNNGGDIALHLAPGARAYEVGIVADVDRHLARAAVAAQEGPANVASLALFPDGRVRVDAASAIRGIATSGWRGRSFSLGIADSATVLATTASAADAAATVIANAVDVADARIRRAPASCRRDDSDLGDRLVTVDVPPLPCRLVEQALDAGTATAEAEIAAGRAIAAALCLQGGVRLCTAGAGFDTLQRHHRAVRVAAAPPAPALST
jgi:ApbE superfamily uncharacterized protein (UPF0280 family)